MTKKLTAQPSTTAPTEDQTKAIYDLILDPARPLDGTDITEEGLISTLDNAARRLHEVADAFNNAARAVKDVIDMDAALDIIYSGVIAEEMITRLAPSALTVMTYRDAVPVFREAAAAAELRADALRLEKAASDARAARRRTRGTCVLRGSKRA